MERARGFFKKFLHIIKKPEMRIIPGQISFFLLLSLIPLAALLGAIAASLQIPNETIQEVMSGAIPNAVVNFLIQVISYGRPNFNMVVFFISAFILASNGPHSIIIASNEIYKIQSRNYIARRLKAILMTFVIAGLFLILFLIPIFGDYILGIVTNNVQNEVLIKFLTIFYEVIKYPLLIIVLYYNIKLIYVIAPDEKIKSLTTTKGSIFTTAGWILATEVYSFYIGAFTKYDVFYGSISNIVILLLWIYILSYILDIGLIINAGEYRQHLEESKVVEEE